MKIIAKALLYNPNGKVLVLRRSKTHPKYAYHRDFPGGSVDTGESAESAVIREIFEETGIIISSDQNLQLALSEQPKPHKLHCIFEYQLKTTSRSIKLSWEHDQYDWLNPKDLLSEQLPRNLNDYYQTVITYLA